MQQFKIRCSAIGQIMTNPRSKSETLSETTKTYLETWMKEQIYKRNQQFSSKYTDKGNIVEQDSLDFIADELGYGLLIKNEESYENEFMTGTPDVILKDEILDVKNSWDCFTFPLFSDELPNKNYYWQMQGYMALTNKPQAKVIYTLMNTPINLIEREAFFYCKNNGYDNLDDDILNEFKERMTYDNIESKFRVKEFVIKRDEESINKIYKRVEECNEHLKKLQDVKI